MNVEQKLCGCSASPALEPSFVDDEADLLIRGPYEADRRPISADASVNICGG